MLAAPDSPLNSSSSAWHTICSEPSHILHSDTAYHLLQPKLASNCQAFVRSLPAAHFEWTAAGWQSKICSLPLATGE